LVDHDPPGRLASEERPLQVHRHDAVEVFLRFIEERPSQHDAGDVAPYVEPTMVGRHPLSECVDVRLDRYVEGHPLAAAAGGNDLVRGGLCRLAVDVGAHDSGSGAGQGQRAGLADPTPGPGHDRHFAVDAE
jgi:hypothetical protein